MKHWILITLLLTGCGKVQDYLFEEEDLEFVDELSLVASNTVNGGMPLRVDFVVVKNPELGKQIAQLSARRYMHQRRQLKLDHPRSLKIKSFELIPGETIITPLPYLKKEVSAAFIFADYNNHKVNRWRVYSADFVKVALQERTLQITSHNSLETEKTRTLRQNDGVILMD